MSDKDVQKGISITSFAIDAKKEVEGAWVEVGAGLRILVARITSPKYEEFMRRKGRPFGRQIQAGRMDASDPAFTAIMCEAISRHILLGWENLTDEHNDPVVYSQEVAFRYLTDYKDFLRIVVDFANDLELFKESDHEVASKNLPTSLSGT